MTYIYAHVCVCVLSLVFSGFLFSKGFALPETTRFKPKLFPSAIQYAGSHL
jgi:hypothetical protein